MMVEMVKESANKTVAKHKHHEHNVAMLKSLHLPFVEQGKNTFRLTVLSGVIIYYAASDKWQHRGKVYHGSVSDLKNWIKNKRMLG